MRDYASQFETLLGRLDSYDEGLMLNQFIWGLQPDLARSVSLHYPILLQKLFRWQKPRNWLLKHHADPGQREYRWKSGKRPQPTKSGARPMEMAWRVLEVDDIVAEVLWVRLGVIPEAEEDVDVVTL